MRLDMFLLTPNKEDDCWDELAYWRKANAIHNWFVDNVQGGVDNCGVYEVAESDLDNLLDICQSVAAVCEWSGVCGIAS